MLRYIGKFGRIWTKTPKIFGRISLRTRLRYSATYRTRNNEPLNEIYKIFIDLLIFVQFFVLPRHKRRVIGRYCLLMWIMCCDGKMPFQFVDTVCYGEIILLSAMLYMVAIRINWIMWWRYLFWSGLLVCVRESA